ncbi:lectin BRA-3-like [Amphibalanus amphitrite]|uniref:lectin BRA-3-like n=1 Tax=Amphibalanus amphitrite TaxID=1232801 RepID=UPI001C90C13D|nr:lectin BRA-3-like [Amphibalanus amphitrite]
MNLLFTLLLLAVAATAPSHCSCPSEQWIAYRSFCYLLIDYEWTWDDAQDACQTLHPGATHASTHDEEQNTFLAENVAGSHRVWLGLRQPIPHYDWFWDDSSDVDFTSWDTYEPRAGPMSSCAVLNSVHTGKWASEDCTAYHSRSICQIKL